MRRAGAFAALLILAACAAADPAPAAEAPATEAPPQIIEPPAPSAPPQAELECAGAFTQGGVAICRTLPGVSVSVDDLAVGRADANGWIVIGFNREHGPEAVVRADFSPCSNMRPGQEECTPIAVVARRTYAIAPREFDVQRIDGLPQQTVTPTDPAVLARIQREAAMKRVGFDSMADLAGFLDGFIWPVEGRISGRWGNQRILNGTPSTPHFGVDIAAPTGTPIRAPAAGVVSFANPDMHYEGGLVFIDHGQGLITMYLHMSRLDVVEGQRVAQGDVIGAVGASGRATGPHLCWRMRWRERQLDPSVAIEGLAAARTELASR